MAGSDDKLKSSGLTNFTPIYPKVPRKPNGTGRCSIKIPFIFGIIPPAFMVKMFNKMSAKPFNDCGIDHGGSKDP